MKLATLEDLFVAELRDLYSAEEQTIQALPMMAKAAASSELQSAFEDNLDQTMGHLDRLDNIFEMLGVSPRGKQCKAIEGMIEEAKELMESDAEAAVMDAGLIAGAQKVEHYEIAGYGTVRTFAQQLGHDEAAELLQETLNEELETDEKLTELAESVVNEKALASTSSGLD